MVGKFAYPVDFVVLEIKDNIESRILGIAFLATSWVMIDVQRDSLTLRFGTEKVILYMEHQTHIPLEEEGHCNRTDTITMCLR